MNFTNTRIAFAFAFHKLNQNDELIRIRVVIDNYIGVSGVISGTTRKMKTSST